MLLCCSRDFLRIYPQCFQKGSYIFNHGATFDTVRAVTAGCRTQTSWLLFTSRALQRRLSVRIRYRGHDV